MPPGSDCNLTPFFDCLRSIDQHVHEHLIQLIRMAFDFRNLSQLLNDADALLQLMLNQGERTLDAFMNMRALPLGFIEPREVFQASNDLHDPIRSDFIIAADFRHDVQEPDDLLVARRSSHLSYFRDSTRHDVVVAVYRADRSVDFMSHTRYKQAERSHFFRLNQLRSQLSFMVSMDHDSIPIRRFTRSITALKIAGVSSS